MQLLDNPLATALAITMKLLDNPLATAPATSPQLLDNPSATGPATAAQLLDNPLATVLATVAQLQDNPIASAPAVASATAGQLLGNHPGHENCSCLSPATAEVTQVTAQQLPCNCRQPFFEKRCPAVTRWLPLATAGGNCPGNCLTAASCLPLWW